MSQKPTTDYTWEEDELDEALHPGPDWDLMEDAHNESSADNAHESHRASRRPWKRADDGQTHLQYEMNRQRSYDGHSRYNVRVETNAEYLSVDAYETTDELRMQKHELAESGVVFGVYGVDEWATNAFLRKQLELGKSSLCVAESWIVPSTFDLQSWVFALSPQFNFTSPRRALVFVPWGLLEVTLIRTKLVIELNGEPEPVLAFRDKMDAQFERARNMIQWIYDRDGSSVSVPLNYRPAIKSAYPWLSKPLDEYINDYLNNDASVLILIGPPGTGKTTFIKNVIYQSKGDARITYDTAVMESDGLFAKFVQDKAQFLILEDSDNFLIAREDGNSMMHKFLNVSDGLISTRDKKLIFSTNLPSVRSIDSALMRPGRCFDVVEFRSLTRNEAQAVYDETGNKAELPDGNDFTLAELFGHTASGSVPNRKAGFY